MPRRQPSPACTSPPPPPPPPDTLRTRLEQLLHRLPRYADRAEEEAARLPERVQTLFGRDGPLAGLRFWRENRQQIEDAAGGLREAGAAAARGDLRRAREHAAGLDLKWLTPPPAPAGDARGDDGEGGLAAPARLNLEKQLRNATMYAVDTLTPWDYDRHDFGLTFAQTWEEAGPGSGGGRVKLTSTLKPLEREWKLSARSQLVEMPAGACVFGKAGMYLAGDKAAYVGVEADRMWPVPRTGGAKLFVNVNYRSSRRPEREPVKMSVGVQKGFEVWGGMVVWVRVGVDVANWGRLEVTPVPNGEYF